MKTPTEAFALAASTEHILRSQYSLVIIEEKLDDSGKDVVWQPLKYAINCSTLSKPQIAELFQQHLDKSSSRGQDAEDLIMISTVL
ncbi:hypothetical protein [Allopusillimonas ginsengisoli]|uniref:hypothetical protein n=1 Tax=Allopusillimonas ginsengisoli TaxID=453575 RepID=UPI001020A671|nr:hypothetical protein [Allopusillimonas ginsengisoli]TEA79785.1 hypothetical protein ERE07_02250 [Allopusillimonas ginsengisoli]